jgi:hypothetical protein
MTPLIDQTPLTKTLPGRLPLLDDLLQVGPDRPLGSIAIGKLHDARIDPSDVLAVLAGQPGVRTKVFSGEECSYIGGAIFAWHEAALNALIRGHLPLLIETGWPTMHPAQFVGAVAAVHTGEPELYRLIGRMRGDDTAESRATETALFASGGQLTAAHPPLRDLDTAGRVAYLKARLLRAQGTGFDTTLQELALAALEGEVR